MRIERLEIQNFKKFASLAIDLHPHFNLLVGENGAGKTSILDALAVAGGIWLVHPPDGMVQNSKRNLLNSEIRLMAELAGDRIQFKQVLPASVTATGSLGGSEGVKWTRLNRSGSGTSDHKALDALSIILGIYERDLQGEKVLCPILAYYGAGRAWLPSNKRWTVTRPKNLSRRWSAFYDCFNERIRFADLNEWFLGETLAAVNRNGRMRPGFEVVKRAILRCVPDADNIWYDHDRKQLVVSVSNNPQPLDNLSAGQGMMVALIADLAIKMITQNAYLLPPDELGAEDALWPRVLRETPGIVLIDELDVHLHPKWQRRVATDLKDTFPCIQFVCTSHSPQVIGEVMPEEVRLLSADGVITPNRTFGIDSDRVLDELMDATSRNQQVKRKLGELAAAIDQEDFGASEGLLKQVEATLGENDPEVTHYRTLIGFLKETK